MGFTPFILRAAKLCDPTRMVFKSDSCAFDDPLPGVVEAGSSGCVVSHETKFTEVRRETSDEN